MSRSQHLFITVVSFVAFLGGTSFAPSPKQPISATVVNSEIPLLTPSQLSSCQVSRHPVMEAGVEVGFVQWGPCRFCTDCKPQSYVVDVKIDGAFEGRQTVLTTRFTDKSLDGVWDWFEAEPDDDPLRSLHFYQGGKGIYRDAMYNQKDPHYNWKTGQIRITNPLEVGVWDRELGLLPYTDQRLEDIASELAELRKDGNILMGLTKNGKSLASQTERVKRIIRVQPKFAAWFARFRFEQNKRPR